MRAGHLNLIQRIGDAGFFINKLFCKRRHTDDGIHRRTDIMGHIAEEDILGGVCLPCLSQFGAQRGIGCRQLIRAGDEQDAAIGQCVGLSDRRAVKALGTGDHALLSRILPDDRILCCHSPCSFRDIPGSVYHRNPKNTISAPCFPKEECIRFTMTCGRA